MSYHAISVINGTIPLVRSRLSNGDEHNFFGHVMPLTLASPSSDVKGIINGTTSFVSSDNQNKVQHWHCCWHHTIPMAPKTATLHSLGQDN